ncbi:DUF3788 family protein [Cognataquiflexum rubidum]|uniref:DUF3788 family protein n=1 Tax=Cognataquiflexum rubidum TaxID=2922273 RepID=UPI001F132C29|nr:DUF3788 family protein [Cognataquiflexum rubidum]MCH6232617.1 DUF3788 domain-containing protein [Cognataquiflexum rubidum]
MKAENQQLLLRDELIVPTDKVLEKALREDIFQIYCELREKISVDFGLDHEWRYYKDGKTWLFKATHKKKTVFWLSAWENLLKVSFYFTQNSHSGTFDLQISDATKENFRNGKPVGKLIPLTLEIDQKEQLMEVWEIVKYKKGLM